MTLSDPKPGGWAANELLTSAQMNAIRTELLKCIDGAAGGTYSLTANLQLQGAGNFVIAAVMQVASSGQLQLLSGSAMNVQSGANVNLASGGAINLASGSSLDLAAGASMTVDGCLIDLTTAAEIRFDATSICRVNGSLLVNNIADIANGATARVNAGGNITVQSGGTLICNDGGEILPFHSEDTRLTSNRNSSFRCHLGAAIIQGASGGAMGWSSAGGASLIQRDVSVQIAMFIPINLAAGDELQQINILVDAGSGRGSLPTNMPDFQLLRTDTSGGSTTIGSATDPAGDLPTYESGFRTIILSSGLPHTLTADAYYLRIRGENAGGAAADKYRIQAVYGLVRQRSYRAETDKL